MPKVIKKTERGTVIAPAWTEEWLERVLKAEGERGRPICGAFARQKSRPCPNPPLPNGRCANHGGKSTGVTSEVIVEQVRNLKFGSDAVGLKEKLYKEINGTDYRLDDPIEAALGMSEISALLVYRYIGAKKDLTLEEVAKACDLLEKAINTNVKLMRSIVERKRGVEGLSQEQLDAMSAQERLKYINNLLFLGTLTDDKKMIKMYEHLSRGLKYEGDLAEANSEELEDEVDTEIVGPG